MPNQSDTVVVENNPSSKKGEMPEFNQNVVAQMLQITMGKQYTPTTEQVDKILALQEKGMDYTHNERKSFLPKDILQYGMYALVVVGMIGVFVFSAFYAKEYLGIISSGMVGLVMGGVGGYGVGSGKTKKND